MCSAVLLQPNVELLSAALVKASPNGDVKVPEKLLVGAAPAPVKVQLAPPRMQFPIVIVALFMLIVDVPLVAPTAASSVRSAAFVLEAFDVTEHCVALPLRKHWDSAMLLMRLRILAPRLLLDAVEPESCECEHVMVCALPKGDPVNFTLTEVPANAEPAGTRGPPALPVVSLSAKAVEPTARHSISAARPTYASLRVVRMREAPFERAASAARQGSWSGRGHQERCRCETLTAAASVTGGDDEAQYHLRAT
jgi:hypothetical protein